MTDPAYVGRFAPSPTGPLHLGSLLTALASFLQARNHGGKWLLRMEDLDRPRMRPEAAGQIMQALEEHGLEWDGEILYQSRRDDAYTAALQQLIALDLVYACTCTRQELLDSQVGIDGPVYPGTCRLSPPVRPQRHALRLKVNDARIELMDAVQGAYRQSLATDTGDFVLKRSDGLFAYQLAVIVDDSYQNITDVVRGADLLASTPRQIYLQSLLGHAHPSYLHVPVLVNGAGDKLSKQNHADPIAAGKPASTLLTCLRLLGQAPLPELADANPREILCWAASHWDVAKLPRVTRIPAPAMA